MDPAIIKSSHILIVDDNPNNLQVLGKLLKERKYEVEFAIDGQSALEWIREKKFDLILLDINMPGMSGFEVCTQIRSKYEPEKLPIIFLSSENDKESILKGFEVGGQDYLTKPFDSKELIVRVNTHLTLKNSLERLENLNQLLEEKITERTHQLVEANDKLNAANHKLIDLDIAKMEFLSLISHEIRTPLNGIVGPLQLIKQSPDINTISEMVEILDSSVSRLEKFSSNALLLTKLRTMPPLSVRIIKPYSIISEVIGEKKDDLNKKNIEIETILDPGLTIIGNKNLIKICFAYIIDNSVRYSPDRAVIEIKCNRLQDLTVCEIRDHGPGFSEKVIARQFELFVIDRNLADNQVGLDLPIVKMIMDFHGGNIKITNHTDGGAVVKLEFVNNRQFPITERQF
jgi:two-component system, sensor histidine kinase and response regulator